MAATVRVQCRPRDRAAASRSDFSPERLRPQSVIGSETVGVASPHALREDDVVATPTAHGGALRRRRANKLARRNLMSARSGWQEAKAPAANLPRAAVKRPRGA
jgi:hypothetical protein